MRRHRRGMPYIRRANGHELGDVDLSRCRLSGRRFYVLVTHGRPMVALACGYSKAELRSELCWHRLGWKMDGTCRVLVAAE